MLCVKFDLIGWVVLERKILKFRQCIFAILLLSFLGKGNGPSIEQTWIPFKQGCFVPKLFEIGPVVLEKKIFKVCQYCVFLLFSYYLPLEKGVALYQANLNPLQTRISCAQFGWNWLSGSGEEDEKLKSLRQRGWERRWCTTDNFLIRKPYLTLRLRWLKKN